MKTDATLVVRKDSVLDVRPVIEALRAMRADEVVQPRMSIRPLDTWPSENWIAAGGHACVACDEDFVALVASKSVYLRRSIAHRMESACDESLRVRGVHIGEHLGEDDIERVEDDWQRSGIGSSQGDPA